MNLPDPPIELITVAATLRAAGERWDDIARKVNRSAGRVRDWPRVYPAEWARHYRAAETRVFAEITIEARHHLIGLLRSTDEGIKLRAVIDTLKLRGVDRDREFKAEVAAVPDADPELLAYVSQIRDMSDAEAAATLQQWLAAAAEERGEPVPEYCTVKIPLPPAREFEN